MILYIILLLTISFVWFRCVVFLFESIPHACALADVAGNSRCPDSFEWWQYRQLSTAQTLLGISYPGMTSWIQNRRRNTDSRVYPQIPSLQFAIRTQQNKWDFHGTCLVGYFTPFELWSLVWKLLLKLVFAQHLPSLKKGRWELHSLCLNVKVTCFQVLQLWHFQGNTLLYTVHYITLALS